MRTIRARIRTETGKERVKKARKEGKIPAVLYGKGVENKNLWLDEKEFVETIKERPGIYGFFKLVVEDTGEEYKVRIQEVQKHFLNWNPIHVDFHAVNDEDVVEHKIPIIPDYSTGKTGPERVLFVHRFIKVKGKVKDLPEYFDVKVGHLEEKEKVYVKDLPVPDNVKVLVDPKEVVLQVL